MSWNDGTFSEMVNEEMDLKLYDLYEQYLEVRGIEQSTDADIEEFGELVKDKLTRRVS